MDDNLKSLMQEVGEAVNQALAESDQLNEVRKKIKGAGYNVFLVLELTIGFNRNSEDEDETTPTETQAPPLKAGDVTQGPGKIKLTAKDHMFLKALKIDTRD